MLPKGRRAADLGAVCSNTRLSPEEAEAALSKIEKDHPDWTNEQIEKEFFSQFGMSFQTPSEKSPERT